MKIDICSDLHLDFGPVELPGGDFLILAGDICEARYVSAVPTEKKHNFYPFFLEQCSKKYSHTLYVMGNHEHYGSRIESTAEKLRSQLPDNVQLLDNQTAVIDGIKFIGSTLWTNANNGDPMTNIVLTNGIHDYKYIRQTRLSNYMRLDVQRTVNEHKRSLQYIEHVLSENQASAQLPVVVISHHAPTHLSVVEKFRSDYHMNGGFVSDLSNTILDYPNLKLWVHGHTHHRFDYQIGQCRVICNPHGYRKYEPELVNTFSTKTVTIDQHGNVTA